MIRIWSRGKHDTKLLLNLWEQKCPLKDIIFRWAFGQETAFSLQMMVTEHEHLFKCYLSRLRANVPIIKELILLNLFLNILFSSLVNSISLPLHESSRHNVNIQPQWRRTEDVRYARVPDRTQNKLRSFKRNLLSHVAIASMSLLFSCL